MGLLHHQIVGGDLVMRVENVFVNKRWMLIVMFVGKGFYADTFLWT